jgi:hypothetical protein
MAEFAGFAASWFRRIMGAAAAKFDGRANVATARMSSRPASRAIRNV